MMKYDDLNGDPNNILKIEKFERIYNFGIKDYDMKERKILLIL